MISICIPCCNDQEELNICIDSIERTCNLEYEIVVCDDGSKYPLEHKGAKIIKHKNQIGVGAAIDTAVANSKFDNIIISGSDIVFMNDHWDEVCVIDLNGHPKSVFTDPIVGYSPDDKHFTDTKRYGCRFLLKANINDIPLSRRYAFSSNWQMLYRSKWHSKHQGGEISNILGARYFIKNDWYNHLKGFNGHRYWGSLDSYLGMKSWLAGGDCRCDVGIAHGHIYSRNNASKPQDWFLYNKILVTRTLFPEKEEELLDWIKHDLNYRMGLNIANSYPLKGEIEGLTEYLQSIFTRDYDWYVNKVEKLNVL